MMPYKVTLAAVWFLLALVFSAGAYASSDQKLVVSDEAYYLDGREAQDLDAFESGYDPDEPIMIEACICADVSRLTAAMDWLSEKRKGEMAIRSVTATEQPLCGRCERRAAARSCLISATSRPPGCPEGLVE